jgi:tetratricopeptide (TPR) repeat protein
MFKASIKGLLGKNRADLLKDRVQAADARGDAAAAIAALRELLEIEPRNAELWLSLADRLRQMGEPLEAANSYEKAIACGAAEAPLLLQLGALHNSLDNFVQAERCFSRLVQLEPDHADALCMLGVVTKEQRRFHEAIEYFERALKLKPEFPEVHFNLGLTQFEAGELGQAQRSFLHCVELQRGRPWGADRAKMLEMQPQPVLEPMDMGVNEIKLRHDCEQLKYLLEGGKLSLEFVRVLEDYQALYGEIEGKLDENTLIPLDERRHPWVARTYKRPIHIADVPPPADSIINPELDFEAIQNRYLAAEPNVLAIDNLLTPHALGAVRRFCRESTIWNDIKPGYLGAYFQDGFCSELLLRLAWELRACMPRVIKDLTLQMMWGFKCDCTMPGLAVHADAAAVNVNFWITEDEANLDPHCGGLLVYEKSAPKNWDFRAYNHDARKIQEYLESVGSKPTRYPYRANRALIFDSDLFHATDHPRFKPGYVNRRINITLLYGNRSA